MPRSKVRPNVSTYHEAIYLILGAEGTSPGLPLTKTEDKFTTKSVAYLAGRFGLPITAKIQEIYAAVAVVFGLPDNFITMVRVMQQGLKGIEIPQSYGTFEENVLQVREVTDRIREWEAEYQYPCEDEDDGTCTNNEAWEDTPELESDDTPVECAPEGQTYEDRRREYEELAAANPLAAAFARMIINSPDEEEDEYDEDWGTWGETVEGIAFHDSEDYAELDEDGSPYV